MWPFHLLLPCSLPREGSFGETAAVFPVWDAVPWFQKKQSRTCSHIIMHACSNLSGGYLKVLFSDLPNSDLRPEKQWHCLEMLLGELTTYGRLGQKIMAQIYNRLPKSQEEKLGKILQELGHSQSICVYRQI